MHPGRQNDRRGGTEEHDGDEGLTTGLLGRLAGRMAALAASSSSHSLVECVGLRPCEDGPRLAEPRATSPVVSPNRWMAGLYAPLPEEVTSYELDVVGEMRSEEHTSELQSLMSISYAVLRVKKTNK